MADPDCSGVVATPGETAATTPMTVTAYDKGVFRIDAHSLQEEAIVRIEPVAVHGRAHIAGTRAR